MFVNPKFGKARAAAIGGEPWPAWKDAAIALYHSQEGIANALIHT